MLKVLKAALIYSNNLGYIQKYHYRCVRALTHIHACTHTRTHPLSCLQFQICFLGQGSVAISRAILQKNIPFLLMEFQKCTCLRVSVCVCVAFCARVALCACFPFLPAHPFRSHLRVSGREVKWEMWILRSHQFAKQQGRID